jgi:hypothetical protein
MQPFAIPGVRSTSEPHDTRLPASPDLDLVFDRTEIALTALHQRLSTHSGHIPDRCNAYANRRSRGLRIIGAQDQLLRSRSCVVWVIREGTRRSSRGGRQSLVRAMHRFAATCYANSRWSCCGARFARGGQASIGRAAAPDSR